MAIAITTTFYGIFAANFLFLPTAIKLGELNEDENPINDDGSIEVKDAEVEDKDPDRVVARIERDPGQGHQGDRGDQEALLQQDDHRQRGI